MGFEFGRISRGNLDTCHLDLQLIMEEGIKVSQVDFGISEGHRSVEKQKEYFDRGLSQIDGITKKGKHNYDPSMASDIYAYIPGKPNLSYTVANLAYLAGVITSVAKRLLTNGKITHKIRWGGNWNRNYEIITDQTFQDLPHYELEI